MDAPTDEAPARMTQARPRAPGAAPQATAGKHIEPPRSPRYRAVFVSDVHLGTPDCQAPYLIDFLRQVDTPLLYLVGDIVDLLRMRRRVSWPASHGTVIETILGKARAGTRVVYIPGNHDAAFRAAAGTTVMGVEIHHESEHCMADGRRLLVRHGDELDGTVRCAGLVHRLGDWAYNRLLAVDRSWHRLRGMLGMRYWSFAAFAKTRSAKALAYIESFERAAAHSAKAHGYDGYIGGHIHKWALTHLDGVLYCNDGDWTENCTALVETTDGALQLIHWADRRAVLAEQPPRASSAPASSRREAGGLGGGAAAEAARPAAVNQDQGDAGGGAGAQEDASAGREA